MSPRKTDWVPISQGGSRSSNRQEDVSQVPQSQSSPVGPAHSILQLLLMA